MVTGGLRAPHARGHSPRDAPGRFAFTFTPKHNSWLNLVEGIFFKLARSVPCDIRVSSKRELRDRIMREVTPVIPF